MFHKIGIAKKYKRILLAVDFHKDNAAVINRATGLAELYGAKLMLLHVIEPIGMSYAANAVHWVNQLYDLEASIRSESERQLKELAYGLGVNESDCHLLEGRPAEKIHELCIENSVDLVVLGTHGQHGLQLLLGSTANSVLHSSPCDVLAVRVKRE